MQDIKFDSLDVSLLGEDVFCKDPEALESALATLRQIGYQVKDLRLDADHLMRYDTTPEEMEQSGSYLWYARLSGIRYGKCNSCMRLIETRGIMSHGHACENCGAVTYQDLPEGARIRFKFRDKKVKSIFPQLEMEVVHWDANDGWLYLKPKPVQSDRLGVACGEEATQYLDKNLDGWQLVNFKRRTALKVRYIRMGAPNRHENAIEIIDSVGSIRNYTIVRMWHGVEYSEYGSDFPLPESLYVHELWHQAVIKQMA